jgi:hypothetical protein
MMSPLSPGGEAGIDRAMASITDQAVGQLKLARGQKAVSGHQSVGSDG